MDKLVNIETGRTVKVEELLSSGYIRERMLALGLTKGASIDVIRRGPKDNLTIYNIRGTMIALRKEEGEKIIVSYI
ncbi:MAG: FeoA family protein [Paraclostridium sp.]